MLAMTTFGSAMRLLAVVLVVVLLATVSAPARAEAIDPMTAIAIAGAAVCVVILIVFLVIANTKGPKMDETGMDDQRQPVMVACVEAEGQPRNCWAVDRPNEPVQIEHVESAIAAPQLAPQS
jgi:uncharacterized membrane protein